MSYYGEPERMTTAQKLTWATYFAGVFFIFLGILASPTRFFEKAIYFGALLIGSMVLGGIGRWFRDEF